MRLGPKGLGRTGRSAGLALAFVVFSTASLATSWSCAGDAAPPEESSHLNLLLISVDTLRADRLGCYGYARDTSPALDSFAKRCVRFEHAIAPAPWTIPSHFSLLTGLLPASHGVENSLLLPGKETQLLAELLYPEGWYPFGITGGGWMSAQFGFGRGFRAFWDQGKTFQETVAQAERIVTDRKPYGPWFAFLHTYDVHCPYDPTEPYRSLFQTEGRKKINIDGKCGNPALNDMHLDQAQVQYVSDRYDGGIREMDQSLGELLRFLETEGWLDNTVVVITSDHGEEFMEHGQIGHERSLQRELLEVPLLIYAPGLAPAVVDAPVSLVDVFPTVLTLLGQPVPQELDGHSLVPLMQGQGEAATGQPSSLRWQADLDAWWSSDRLLIVNRATNQPSLFDLVNDPGATQDCAQAHPLETQEMLKQLDQSLARTRHRATQEHAPADPTQADELRRLGYSKGE